MVLSTGGVDVEVLVEPGDGQEFRNATIRRDVKREGDATVHCGLQAGQQERTPDESMKLTWVRSTRIAAMFGVSAARSSVATTSSSTAKSKSPTRLIITSPGAAFTT